MKPLFQGLAKYNGSVNQMKKGEGFPKRVRESCPGASPALRQE
ncbi:MAG: hypothetical protein WCO26_16065 [Deltaproteobacteria bacterium]